MDDNGETAMHGAAYQNWPRMIEFLTASGADVNVWNRNNRWGWTPLLIAHGYREGNFRPDVATIAAIERVMLAAGAKPTLPRSGIVANQQSWDKKRPGWDKEKKSSRDPKERDLAEPRRQKPANGAVQNEPDATAPDAP